MANEIKNVSGLSLRGQFVSLTARSFAGNDGSPVAIQTLKVHDPEGFAYHEINGINDDGLLLANSLAGVPVGTEVVVKLDLSKNGKLKPLSVTVVR